MNRRFHPTNTKPGLENAGKPWTPEEDLEMFAQLRSGKSLDTIASSHKRSVAGITMRLEAMVWELHKSGLSPEDMQKRIPLSINDINLIVTKLTEKEAAKPPTLTELRDKLNAMDAKLDLIAKALSQK